MEILPMLARLEHVLDCDDLAKQMLLLPKAPSATSIPSKEINLVVGYNGSATSQTALDLTLCIAYQTRLATQKSVTVHVVYVVDSANSRGLLQDHLVEMGAAPVALQPDLGESLMVQEALLETAYSGADAFGAATVSHEKKFRKVSSGEVMVANVASTPTSLSLSSQLQQFEKADYILWQARHLADEWRGSFETHLRFGSVVEELTAVARNVSTTALVLGCTTADHWLIQSLGSDLTFSVLGIPQTLSE